MLAAIALLRDSAAKSKRPTASCRRVFSFGNALGESLAERSSCSGYDEAAFSAQADARDAAMSQLLGFGPSPMRGYARGQLGSGAFGVDDYAWTPTFSGGRAARAADKPQEEFRQSERDYRSSTEQSAAGSGYVARNGDSISRILGSSHPQAIGNFMRANGLTSDRIEAGRNYFVPEDLNAYGDSTALGQFALNEGNDRIAAAARSEAQREVNRFAALASAPTTEVSFIPPWANLPRTPEEAAARLLAGLPPATALDRLSDSVRNNFDGPVMTAWDVTGDARAAVAMQRTRNNVAMGAGGLLVAAPMAAARSLGVDEFGAEQTGMQAAAFMDLYAPRGPSGLTSLARVRGVRSASPATMGETAFGAEGISGTGPYREVLGHHVHAKRGFQDVPGYDRMEAFSVSDKTLAEYGVRHADITAAQQKLFRALDASGAPNTLTQHSRIAYQSFVDAGMPPDVAKQLVLQSQSDLIRSGVVAPAYIPWGKKTP